MRSYTTFSQLNEWTVLKQHLFLFQLASVLTLLLCFIGFNASASTFTTNNVWESTQLDSLPYSSLAKGSTLEVAFQSDLYNTGKGEGAYRNKRLSNGKIQIQYEFEKKTTPNPYHIIYDYYLHPSADGAFALDMKGAIDPVEMTINEDMIIAYEGDDLTFSSDLSSLPDAEGKFNIHMPEGDLLLTMHVKVFDRTIKETSIDGVRGKVYLHTYSYQFYKTIRNGTLVKSSDQQVEEWLSPTLGVIKQNRTTDTHEQRPNNMDVAKNGFYTDFKSKNKRSSVITSIKTN